MSDTASPFDALLADMQRSQQIIAERALRRSYNAGYSAGYEAGRAELARYVSEAIAAGLASRRTRAVDAPLATIEAALGLDQHDARPPFSAPARDEGGAEETGDDATRGADTGRAITAQLSPFVEPSGVGEEVAASVDPVPAADGNSPERASEMVGGFPVAAAPSHAEVIDLPAFVPATPREPSKRDHILDLWATTCLPWTQIAAEVGTTPERVNSEIRKARVAGDSRAVKAVDRPGMRDRPGNNIPKPKAAKAPTTIDRVLDLWSSTGLSSSEIAAQLGTTPGTVKAAIQTGRKRDDRRALYPDRRPTRPPTESPQGEPREDKPDLTGECPEAPPADVEPEPAVHGHEGPRRTAASLPAKQLEPIVKLPSNVVGTDADGSLIAIDLAARRIAGPLGETDVSHQVCLMLIRMRDGGLFDYRTLADAGKLSGPDMLRLRLPSIKATLAGVGIEFVEVPKVGCRIRRAEA